MLKVIGPTWACVECLTDDDLPKDDQDLTVLTVWEGTMLCLYHLPKVLARRAEELRSQTTKRRVKIAEMKSTADAAIHNIPIVQCGKVSRNEEHAPHDWMFQAEDDSPEIIQAFCTGYYE